MKTLLLNAMTDRIIDTMTSKSRHYTCRSCPADWLDEYCEFLLKHPEAKSVRTLRDVGMWFHPLRPIFGNEDAVCRYHIKQKMTPDIYKECSKYLDSICE